MIKVEELRVGNWVKSLELVEDYENNPNPTDWVYRKIDCIQDLFDHDDFEPIPLTEEILLKCGNVTPCVSKYLYHVGFFMGEFNGTTLYFKDLHLTIKYLHELQNLRYVLTGKELNIEL